MAVTGSKAFAVSDVDLVSTWQKNSSGTIYNITTATNTRAVTVTIPDDATLAGAFLSVTSNAALGGAQILTANGHNLRYDATTEVDLSDDIVVGSNVLTFQYKSYGSASSTNQRSVCHLSNVVLTVTYTQPDPEPPVDPDPPAGTKESDGLITIHDGSERSFGASLGMAVLTPSKCEVTETAGGDYSVSIEHPITPDGRWRLIQPWMLVRVPVPMSDTPAIDASGGITLGYEIWVVNASSTGLYDSNVHVRYPAWEAGKTYAVGAYVRYNNCNYRCKVPNNYTTWVAGCWVKLGSGDPQSKRSLSQGTRLYVSVAGSEFLTVKLSTGETGYCKRADCVFVREATQADIDALRTSARSIRAQVFRLTSVTVTPQSVSAQGMHVSYDYSAQVCSGLTVVGSDLPNAVLDLRANILGASDVPNIYCQDTGAVINAEWAAGSSPVEGLLNPDTGLVAQAKARLIRDNWDFFLISNEEAENRGFRVEYGVNLTGVSWGRDFSAVVTRVIPVGMNSDGSPLYLEGTIWVESELSANYPMIAWKYLDTGVKVGEEGPDGTAYTVATARAEMLRQAEACFSENHEDEPAVTLEVQFAALGASDAFRQYRALERVSLYDRVTVCHPDLGLDTSAQVKSYTWDALRQRFVSISLGDVFQHELGSMAGWQIADGSITARKLSMAVRQSMTT